MTNWKDRNGNTVRAETRGPAQLLLNSIDPAHGREPYKVITNVGAFANCRRDRFCRCRKCKPPMPAKRSILGIAFGA